MLARRLLRSREGLAAIRLTPQLVARRFDDAHRQLAALWRVAEQLHPDRPLARGYARIEARGTGRTVTDTAGARKAGALLVRFADGAVDVRVEPGPREPYVSPRQDRLL